MFIPALIWFIIIFILLTLPGSDLPSSSFLTEIDFDKFVHISLFSIFVFLISYPFIKNKNLYTGTYILIAVLALVYGILMEFVQKYFAIGRSCDVLDMVADACGCALGFFYAKWRLKNQFVQKNTQSRKDNF